MELPPFAIEVFVPGRVCMFGEHSDWASQLPSATSQGKCLVYNTDVGIHAWTWATNQRDTTGNEGDKKQGEIRIIEVINAENNGTSCNTKNDLQSPPVFKTFTAPMDPNILRRFATDQNEYFAYMCGTAAVMIEDFGYSDELDTSAAVKNEATSPFGGRGITIYNDVTTIPMRKGFSSSAAVCVLVAEAFNRVFLEIEQLPNNQDENSSNPADKAKKSRKGNGRISVDEIMSCALKGEWATGSLCGRMDQCVAFGPQAMMAMTFKKICTEENSSSFLWHEPIKIKKGTAFYFVVADLLSQKDTKLIISDLQQSFSDESLSQQRNKENGSTLFPIDPLVVQQWPLEIQSLLNDIKTRVNSENTINIYLGEENLLCTALAQKALENGDAAMLGALMTLVQYRFNECVVPCCPQELKAPKLHSLLKEVANQRISTVDSHPLSLGGKGVGSQGDGSIQFVCSSKENQAHLVNYLNCKGLLAFAFTIS